MVGAGNSTKKDHRGGDGRRTPFDLEHYETNESRIDLDCEKALALLAPAADAIAGIGPETGADNRASVPDLTACRHAVTMAAKHHSRGSPTRECQRVS